MRTERLKALVAKELKSSPDGSGKVRKEPDLLPPREDVKKRYKKENIPREDKEDYKDTLYDPDLK
ncbi:MAG: hypothetical protein J6Y62_04995 [Clostridia bacterium]|nr:hypothetical protein [Clostridia bacterium]